VTRLIVNADDLGYTEGVTRGILEAHDRGFVTSASMLRILGALDGDVVELGCHPGCCDGLDSSSTVEREHELRTLTDPRVRAAVAGLALEPIRWDDLTESVAAGRSGP
jgi:predicted glycoside hydrolase/deacetylase ChbG (UPF0249 family)